MGYAFNLCKTRAFIVPYNQRNEKEGIRMVQNRVRIVDVADALGLSTATVSKVIHGKTEKISDETVKSVQQELENSGYISNMAGILLARNNSRIIGVVVNDHEKYEGRVLEDDYEKLRNQMRISFVV
jgi:maltose regulon regulatory protein malI